MRKDHFRVGVITEPITSGHLGYWFNSLAGCQGIEQVAVADQSGQAFGEARTSLGRFAADLVTFQDYREMIKDFRPELVLVSLEAHHAPVAIGAVLESGVHVLAEKPACVRAADFEELVDLAESRERYLMLAFACRLLPTVTKARELIGSGFLGKWYGADLFTMADQTRRQDPEYQQSWYGFRDQAGGGHLIWLGIHLLDLIQFITGTRLQQVCGFTHRLEDTPMEAEDAAAMAMRFENGCMATLHSGYYLERYYQSQLIIWGSRGWLRFSGNLGFFETPLQWYSSHTDAPEGLQDFPFTPEPETTVGYQAFVRAAVTAALGQSPPPVTGRECLHVLRTIYSLYRAAETGVTQTIA